MKRSLASLGLLALTLSACNASVTPSDTTPIKLGLISPLTGDAAAIGNDILDGTKMAVDEVNAAGGIDGRMIELIAEDGKCNGTDAASAAQKLVNVDKVVSIVGGFCSGETLAASPIVEAAKVTLLSPGSSSPAITTAGEYVFRNYPSDALRTVAMAKHFNEEGWKKVAIISENTDYATALRDALVKNVGAENVVFNETVDPGTKDYRSLLTRMKGVQFDVFVPNGQSDSTDAAMIAQYVEQGMTKPMVGKDTTDSLTVVDIAADAAEGVQLVNVASFGENTDFEDDFTAKFGAPQSSISWAALAYDAAGVTFEAMKNAGITGEEIKGYFDTLEGYDGIIGTFSFDENGDVVGVSYVLKQFEDGKVVTKKALSLDGTTPAGGSTSSVAGMTTSSSSVAAMQSSSK